MTELASTKLAQDPRIAEAKRLLLEAVNENQEAIVDVRPPNPKLQASYEETIAEFEKIRAGKLWFPYLQSGMGNGPFVELLDGSVKYDFITGIGAHVLGHANEVLLSASIDAALHATVMQGHLQQGEVAMQFSKQLLESSGMDHCFLSAIGAMANENALKMIFHHKPGRHRVIAFDGCFCGRTLGMSSVTDKPAYRQGLPLTLQVDYIPFYDANAPEQSTERSLNAFKKVLKRYPNQHGALIMELVQGEGGYYPGSHSFFKALCTLAHDEGIATIADEVQTYGRLEHPFAFRYFKLDELIDFATVGKMTQVCATLFREEYQPKPGLLSQTFTSSSAAIRAGYEVVKFLREGDFYGPKGQIHSLHTAFRTRFEALHEKYPDKISGPYGIGGMIAFTPCDGSQEKAVEVVKDLYHRGVMSFVAGSDPMRVRFLPPIGAITEEHIEAVCQIIEQTLQNV